MKLVSVLIPAYNHEKYIKECIYSVINQTYKNIEIIVLDDFSTDNTAKVIREIKDKRIKKYFSKKNNGVVYSINELLKKSTGDYISIIGSDDIWYPTKIEKQVEYLERNKNNIGCIFTDVNIIDENSNIYDASKIFDVFKNENMSRCERIKMFYDIGNHLCHSSSMMPRSVFEEIGFYNSSFRQLHDYEYWTRVIQKYDIHILNEKLTGYRRINSNSVSSLSIENTVRHLNEIFLINSKLILGLNDKDFKETFASEFKKDFSDKNFNLDCEKFFIILNMKNDNSFNKFYAFQYLVSNERKMMDKLNKYGYKINDLYGETGNVMVKYSCIDEFESSKKELEKYYLDIIKGINNSISWKITRPLRWLNKKIRSVKK